ncbi:hypothetical protein IQE94_03400 [Synechocystis sp. PCC 7339]|uniref:hypothetical protein n=1 Tax=Synechocystis sp. PCC 7339 TaxID=2782213 RepID=UPI001CBF91C7|nr:hypothetical protein [Synechocystis sp. PCC 7339]UAJ73379.1 hypothetical protein IQE94_03400 [Synechocystis sp. PCC 7339]
MNINGLVPEPTVFPDGTVLESAFKANPVYDPSWGNLLVNWQVLLLQGFFHLAIVFLLKKRQDIL